MPMNRSARTLLSAVFLLAALFVALGYVVEAQPLVAWWLPLALFLAGLGLGLSNRLLPGVEVPNRTEAVPQVREFTVEAGGEAEIHPPLPRDAESSQPPEPKPAPVAPPVVPEKEQTGPVEPANPEAQVVQEKTAAPPMPHDEQGNAAVDAATADEVVNSEPEPETTARVVPVDVGPSGEPDDLTAIAGIGPKTAALLNEHGVYSYEQLAMQTEEQLREMLTNAGMRLAQGVANWPVQAEFLARGDTAGLDNWRQSQ